MSEVPAFPLIINGERCEPAEGQYEDVINPATGKVIARAAMGTGADVDLAVKAARAAFDNREWREMNPTARSKVLYASSRETAPAGYERLFTVAKTGGPSQLVPAPWGHDGSFSADKKHIVVDRIARWDSEWRHYRGGQNTALVILDLDDLREDRIPNERTTDIQPLWMNGIIYFLSDRGWSMNIWSFDPATNKLEQITHYADVDIKWLDGHQGTLIFVDGLQNIQPEDTRWVGRIEINDIVGTVARNRVEQVVNERPMRIDNGESVAGLQVGNYHVAH